MAKTEESPGRRRGHRAPLQSEVKKGRDAEEVSEEERSSSDYRRRRHVPLECRLGFDSGVWSEEEDTSSSESRRGRRVPSKGKKKAAEDSRSGSTKPKMKKQGKKNKRRDAEADVEPPSRTGRRRRR